MDLSKIGSKNAEFHSEINKAFREIYSAHTELDCETQIQGDIESAENDYNLACNPQNIRALLSYICYLEERLGG